MTDKRESGYRFGPRDQRGWFAALRTLQVATLALSLVLALAIARLGLGRHRMVYALGVLLAGAFVSLVSFGGRSLIEWIPGIGSFLGSGISGRRRIVYRSSRKGFVSRASKMFSRLRFVEVVHAGKSVGAVYDQSDHTLSAVLKIEGDQFALLDESIREQRVAEWSSVLAALNSDRSLFRLKWIVQTMPDSSARFRKSIAEAALAAGSLLSDSALSSYSELCEELQQAAFVSEQYVVVSTRLSGARRVPSGKSPGVTQHREVSEFVRQVALVERRMAEMGLAVEGALTMSGLVKMTQRRFIESGSPVERRLPWPVAIEERWESIRTDNLWHATYWISEWPRSAVLPGFLLPLLDENSIRKSVSMCMSPVRQERATRIAERRRTSSVADFELRRRYGFALSSRIRSQHEAVLRREEELAHGHVGYEFSGYVTVSAASPEELQRSCEQVEQSCSLAKLEVRRLFGIQRKSLLFGFANARGCS